jgi:hypothetical protein
VEDAVREPSTYVWLGISPYGMTAASQHLASPTSRAPRWERLLIVLGICLPVPFFAATGLTIPLPATVERLAAALVPWVETAMVDSNGALSGGTIILAPGEHGESAAARDVPTAAVSEHRSSRDTTPQAGGGVKATKGTDAGAVPQPVSPGAGAEPQPVSPEAGLATAPDESKPEPSPKPDPGEKPGDEPGPVQGTVDTVGQTVGSAVGTVEDTADEILSPVGGATDTLEGTVTGILPGLGG